MPQLLPDGQCHPLGGLAQGRVIEMDVTVGRACGPVSEQASCDMQALAVHDRVRSVRASQVVQPRVRHDPGRIPRLEPEPVEVMLVQRFVLAPAGKHQLPGRRFGEAVQQRPCRLAEQNVPRSGLRVNQCQPVGLDLAPTQAAYLGRPASGQHEQAHRRDVHRVLVLAPRQDCAESRKVVRIAPPVRRKWRPRVG